MSCWICKRARAGGSTCSSPYERQALTAALQAAADLLRDWNPAAFLVSGWTSTHLSSRLKHHHLWKNIDIATFSAARLWCQLDLKINGTSSYVYVCLISPITREAVLQQTDKPSNSKWLNTFWCLQVTAKKQHLTLWGFTLDIAARKPIHKIFNCSSEAKNLLNVSSHQFE